jgi:hypothetical protein
LTILAFIPEVRFGFILCDGAACLAAALSMLCGGLKEGHTLGRSHTRTFDGNSHIAHRSNRELLASNEDDELRKRVEFWSCVGVVDIVASVALV